MKKQEDRIEEELIERYSHGNKDAFYNGLSKGEVEWLRIGIEETEKVKDKDFLKIIDKLNKDINTFIYYSI